MTPTAMTAAEKARPETGTAESATAESTIAEAAPAETTGVAEPRSEGSIVDDPEAGATTAEYAILTLAAVAFAGVLAVVIKSGPVQSLLQGLIERALTT